MEDEEYNKKNRALFDTALNAIKLGEDEEVDKALT